MPGKKGWRRGDLERFMERVSPEPNSGCWLWCGIWDDPPRPPYGKFWLNDTNIVAHRAAWVLFNGAIPEGRLVLHKCDVPQCVNPDHLFLGSFRDNTQDMMKKGRDAKCRKSRRGENSNFAKITAVEALEILSDARHPKLIASAYGITPAAIRLIKRRKNWRHLNADS